MVKAILPIVIGVLYFATIYFLVEMWIVSRARLSDYRGKIIDLVWVCTSAVSLLFLLINARDATLRSRIDHQELASLEIKRVFGQKAGSVDNDCRNGNWPPRSVVAEGQSQSRVSEDCEGVRGLIKVAAKLYFENEQLWQGQIDLAKYHE